MYGAVSGAQQAGYGTGQEAFAQSAGYPSQAGVAAYGAFGQQQSGYGGAQVCQQGKQTCSACNAAPSAPEVHHIKWLHWSPALEGSFCFHALRCILHAHSLSAGSILMFGL
jgi:hypothetical protein